MGHRDPSGLCTSLPLGAAQSECVERLSGKTQCFPSARPCAELLGRHREAETGSASSRSAHSTLGAHRGHTGGWPRGLLLFEPLPVCPQDCWVLPSKSQGLIFSYAPNVYFLPHRQHFAQEPSF